MHLPASPLVLGATISLFRQTTDIAEGPETRQTSRTNHIPPKILSDLTRTPSIRSSSRSANTLTPSSKAARRDPTSDLVDYSTITSFDGWLSDRQRTIISEGPVQETPTTPITLIEAPTTYDVTASTATHAVSSVQWTWTTIWTKSTVTECVPQTVTVTNTKYVWTTSKWQFPSISVGPHINAAADTSTGLPAYQSPVSEDTSSKLVDAPEPISTLPSVQYLLPTPSSTRPSFTPRKGEGSSSLQGPSATATTDQRDSLPSFLALPPTRDNCDMTKTFPWELFAFPDQSCADKAMSPPNHPTSGWIPGNEVNCQYLDTVMPFRFGSVAVGIPCANYPYIITLYDTPDCSNKNAVKVYESGCVTAAPGSRGFIAYSAERRVQVS